MKANELMIGDWAGKSAIRLIENGAKEILIPVRVNGLGHYIEIKYIEDGKEVLQVMSPDDLYSIPLTEEILKTNGFYPNDSNGLEIKFPTTFMFRSYVTAYHIEEKNEFIIDVHKVRDDYSSNTVHIVIKYVHELQHALRLCGLNELADNFNLAMEK